MRSLALLVLLLSLVACDSRTVGDTSSFTRLQDGTWERTDAGFTDESIQFRPRQAYTYFEGSAVADQGTYFTRSAEASDDVFAIGYLPDESVREDDEAVLMDGVLTLTAEGSSETRTYRRR